MTIEPIMSSHPAIARDVGDLYRNLHAHPELSHREVRTAGLVAERLRADGFEVHDQVGITGVVGVLRNGDGPCVLVRADMDALPVAERTGLPYASTVVAETASGEVPVMHACGHDVHTACGVGAARLFAGARDAWRGTLIMLFQPAEETADGAESMLRDGLTDLVPRPDVCLAQHVLARPAGTVSVAAGPFLSAGLSMRVTVHGRGAHGSMPHLAVDPVVLAAAIVLRLQTLVSREVTPGEFAVLTVGALAAGTKANIISDHAVLELNLRAYDEAVLDQLVEGIKRIVGGECVAAGSPREPDFELIDRYPLTSNDPAAAEKVRAAFATGFGDRLADFGRQTASEDFSELPNAWGSPYVYWGIGGTDPAQYATAEKTGTISAEIPGNHSPFFAPVPEPTLETGVRAIVTAAGVWLVADVGSATG